MKAASTDHSTIPGIKHSKLEKAGALSIRWTVLLLVTTVWISAGLFGLYILAFYASALFGGNLEKWNGVLPGLYQKGSIAATTGISLHFAMGAIILVLGSIQLIEAIRVRYSQFHRWIGRIYVVSSLLAAVGGLVFIVVKGTIGGTLMDVGFALYGGLMILAGVQTYRHAVSRHINKHRTWALRLYALAIGSWLYRMDYGFWMLLTNGLGHTTNFTGLFDKIMAFFFYVPNLLVTEAFIRSRSFKTPPALNLATALILLLMTGFLCLGTYYFTKMLWGPAIVGWFTNS